MDDLLFSTRDVGQLLGLHGFTVCRWIDLGLMKAHRTAGGHRRILGVDLCRYLLERGIPLPPELARSAGGRLSLIVVGAQKRGLEAIGRAFTLSAAELDLKVTTSPIEALLWLATSRPSGMLIDTDVRGLDAFEVCRRVASFKPLAATRLVAMTSVLRSDVLGSALTAGAVACLEKPVKAREVLELITRPRNASMGGLQRWGGKPRRPRSPPNKAVAPDQAQ